jgi:uncharacterized membrane protein YGL010W
MNFQGLNSLLPNPVLLLYFKDYEQVHRTRGNKLTHYFGIPLVLLSLLGLLSHVTLLSIPAFTFYQPFAVSFNLALILLGVGSAFAFRADWKLAIPFTLFNVLGYLIFKDVPIATLIILQTLGWLLQLWGHYYYEKKSPAFFKSIEHTIVGPLWIFARLIRYYTPS